jgi:hypothetical protein
MCAYTLSAIAHSYQPEIETALSTVTFILLKTTLTNVK